LERRQYEPDDSKRTKLLLLRLRSLRDRQRKAEPPLLQKADERTGAARFISEAVLTPRRLAVPWTCYRVRLDLDKRSDPRPQTP